MSLPPAKKDISDNPAKNAVTVPVDATLRDQDINRKVPVWPLHLVG